ACIATVDQNKTISTIRNTEVVSDATNVLALECAARRRQLLRVDPRSRQRVRLATSHRVVRGQTYRARGAASHFRLLGLCVAGRDEGSFEFEVSSLVEQIPLYLRLLQATTDLGLAPSRIRLALTDLEDGQREPALRQRILEPVEASYPDVRAAMDPDRQTGRGYYVGACF